MSQRTINLGRTGEMLASDFLISNGHEILAKNFRFSRTAEIDIVTKLHDTIVFVEVKTRNNARHGRPSEAVNVTKQRKIIKAALSFLQKNNLFDSACRFDVIEIFADQNKDLKDWKINHIENAFEIL